MAAYILEIAMAITFASALGLLILVCRHPGLRGRQNSVDIPAALWKHYRDIAIRERSSVRAVILDVLRKNVEGVA